VNAGWIWKMFGKNPYTGSQGPLYREIYVRWYHKFEVGFEGIPPKMARLRVFSPEHWQGAHTTHFWLEPSTGEIAIDPVSYVPAGQNYVDPNQARWLGIVETDFSFNVPENIGRWVCFEMKVKLNDAGQRNGEIEYFADGGPIGSSINLDMVGSYDAYGLNGMQWDTYWNAGSPKAQNRYYDNLVISTEPIGCIDSDSTFVDVPPDHPYHDHIEALYQAGYIAGCSTDPLMYCPEQTMTRAESAVFVERGVHGAGYLPTQPTEEIYADVPLWEWYAKWSTGLWEDGYTAGCGTDPLTYCPLQGHTRAEGCVFFLRMLNGVDYVPPDPQGIFTDVPVEYWGAKWIEAAYNAGLIPACETNPELRFCPDDPLDRGMGAYMMAQVKGLAVP
jgi:hypothetical protein